MEGEALGRRVGAETDLFSRLFLLLSQPSPCQSPMLVLPIQYPLVHLLIFFFETEL